MSREKPLIWLPAFAGSASLFFPIQSVRRNASFSPPTPTTTPNSVSLRRAASQFSIPMTFEPNVGQADSRAQFIGRGKGLSVLLGGDAISVELPAHTYSKIPGA